MARYPLPHTFKIQVRYRSDYSRRQPTSPRVDRYVIVRRDADDFGYVDKDGTMKHLRDSLKFALQQHASMPGRR